jgi:parallel beta-helix repeat protein
MKKIILLFCFYFGAMQGFGQTVNTEALLRIEISNFNASATAATTITLGNNIEITGVNALPAITNTNFPLIINGVNYVLKRSSVTLFRILEISTGCNVIINNLKIRDGNANNANGGGIFNNGNLTLNNCTISDNTASDVIGGGGIFNDGVAANLTLKNCTINDNSITGTSSIFKGAGIYHNGASLTMSYCTVSRNTCTGSAGFEGAGIYLGNSNFQLNNLSVVSNTAAAGVTILPSFTSSQIQNSLFLANSSSDIQYLGTSLVDISAQKILFNQTAGSLTTAATQAIAITSEFIDIISPSLRDNGGPTFTHALLANSANSAIEGGTPIVLPTTETDQRGDALLGTNRDIGAYEFGTFWVTDNTGLSSNFIGTLSKSLKDANFSFPNAPQNNLNNASVLKKIKFNIPAPNNTVELFFNPILKLPIIIDATTQKDYTTQPNSRVKLTRSTGNGGTALHINTTATGSKVLGLVIGIDVLTPFPFATGIKISADNVQIGEITTSPAFDGLNVFQRCTNAIIINGSNTTIQRNYFGLNVDGTDGLSDTNNTGYDLIVGDSVSITGTKIGASVKSNIFAAKSGGISFASILPPSVISNTTIAYNQIGEDLNRNIIAGAAAGIHTNGDVDILAVSNNVIVNRDLAAAIFLNNNSKNITIENNQIGWEYNTANIPTARPCLYGIQIRGGGLSDKIKIQNNSVAGNKPSSSSGKGIYIENGTYPPNAILIENNRIGLSFNNLPALPTILPNHWGIHSENANSTTSNFLTIKGNRISGNDEKGIYMDKGTGIKIEDNILGLNTDNSNAPNKGVSIHMAGQGSIDGNTVAGNFLSPNSYDAIEVGANNVIVKNNFIGNDGTNILPNSGTGISISTSGLSVLNISNNTISGNSTGIITASPIATFTGNKIGCNSTGTAKLTGIFPWATANQSQGIRIDATATPMTITNNIFADNGTAIDIRANDITVTANRIGVINNGTNDIALPNSTGISIGSNLSDITIGGVNITDGNSFAATDKGILTSSACTIQNNLFGTSHDGNLALTNFGNSTTNGFSSQAISVASTATNTQILDNIICGARNTNAFAVGTVSGTGTADAISIAASVTIVRRNKIGLTKTTPTPVAIPNDVGITFSTPTGTINSCFIEENIIANNINAGIYAACNTSDENTINNNAFGMRDNGLTTNTLSTLPTKVAIAIDARITSPALPSDFSSDFFVITNNVINKTSSVAIILQSNSNRVQSNLLGITRGGASISNTGAGILIGGASLLTGGNNNTIGGSTADANTIRGFTGGTLPTIGILVIANPANNAGRNNRITNNQIFENSSQGISITGGFSNRISQNSIHSNGSAANIFAEKGIDLNLATAAGNLAQPALNLTSFTLSGAFTSTYTVPAIAATGNYTVEFFRTTGIANANQAEGKEYIGSATMNVPATNTTINFNDSFTPFVSLNSSDYITATVTSPQVLTPPALFPYSTNTSEFSNAITICSTTITSITTQNVITTCFGTTADVRLNISTNSNAGSKFDIDTDNNGTFDYTGIDLQTDAAGKFLLLTGVTGGTVFTNTKVFDLTQNCLSPSFANTVTISNAIKPQPIIRAARLVQATSCSNPNARLIVKLQNFEPNAYYSIRIGGVNPLLAQLVGDSLTAVLANVAIGTSIGSNLQVSQAPNCISPNFPFSAVLQTPSPAPDTTLNVSTPNDEISPNFAAQILVESTKDSIMYSLARADNLQVIGTEKQGSNGTNLTFSTGILTTDGTYKYVISARHIRTNCVAQLAKTVTIKVFSGIYSEDLDILREIYTSTNGDNWDIKWNFALSFTTFIGVSTFGGRVTSILLPNNNLTGVLTRNTLNLRKLANLDISSNSLDFGSVEPFVNQRFAFTYSNQARINRSIDTTAYTGTSMVLTASTRGTANSYQWQKDGVNIAGATSNSLTINPLQNTDAGTYTCIIRNTIGTQLILTRNNIRLRTITRNVSSTDLTLLIKLNESLGGANWTNKWKLDGTVPVAELYGIKMEGDKIKYINLADNNLVGTIPDIIPLGNNILSDLIYLNLSGNQISGTIPASIGNLKKLQYLDLSNNALSGEINKEIGDLPDLNTLWLGNNQFKALHSGLANLAKLENFFAQNNQFTTVFADWSKLTALKKLNLSGNLLKTLPQSLDKLLNLEVLELVNNQFVTLPNIFGNMKKLQEIYLQNNQLTDLPTSFATLTSLQNMVLHTNFLDFEDLEKLQPLPVLNAEGAIYEPQAKIGTAQEILFTTDQTLDITQPAKGTANSYLWLKDGQPVNNLTMQQILRNPIAFSDAGVYTLTIKNSVAQKLTLFSREILVRVSCGNSSSIEISQAGTNRYCEGENINTTLSAKTLNGIQAIGYQWFRNNARLVNEETNKLSLVQAGSYVVHIRGGDGCVFISQPVEILMAAKPKIDLKQVEEKLQVTVNQSKGKLQYAWYYNNLQIEEARNSELKTAKAGQYYVIVTDSLNCPAKSQVINVIISGLEDEQNANFKLYPNPTENVLNIEIPMDFDFQTLQVYNLLGQLATIKIQKQDTNVLQVQVANLSSGVYWVEIKGRKGSLKRKFVKE